MKKIFFLGLVLLMGLCAGCSEQPEGSKQDEIPFQKGQLYAVAHLGYQKMTDLDSYAAQYLDSDELPVHYISDGDFYLVIPRYADMELALYRNDMESMEPILIYQDPDCGPFVLQCNVSDIFADATICLCHGEEEAEFSPFISLKDGSVDVGTRGLLLAKPEGSPASEG